MELKKRRNVLWEHLYDLKIKNNKKKHPRERITNCITKKLDFLAHFHHS